MCNALPVEAVSTGCEIKERSVWVSAVRKKDSHSTWENITEDFIDDLDEKDILVSIDYHMWQK